MIGRRFPTALGALVAVALGVASCATGPAASPLATPTASPTPAVTPTATPDPTATPVPTPYPVDLGIVEENLVALADGTLFTVDGSIATAGGGFAADVTGDLAVSGGMSEVDLVFKPPAAQGDPGDVKAIAEETPFVLDDAGRWLGVTTAPEAQPHLAAVLADPGPLEIVGGSAEEVFVELGSRLDVAGLGCRPVGDVIWKLAPDIPDPDPMTVLALVDPSGEVLRIALAFEAIGLSCGRNTVVTERAEPFEVWLELAPAPLPSDRPIVLPSDTWVTYDSERYLYRLVLPATWTFDASRDYDLFAGPQKREFSVWAFSDAGTLDAFVKAERARYLELYRAKPSSESDATMGGEAARILTYAPNAKFQTAAGDVYVPVMYLVLSVHQGNGYGLQWWGPKADAKAGLTTLTRFLEDFEFTY